MNSAIGNFSDKLSSVIPLFGHIFSSCKIIQGNSGSPVFNSAGKVVSVLFATIDREAIETKLNIRNARNMALATNLACIRISVPAFDALRPIECDPIVRDEARYLARMESRFNRESEESRKKKGEALKAFLPMTFTYDLIEKKTDSEGKKYSFDYKPNCMMNPSGWTESEKLKIVTTNNIRKYSTNVASYAYALTLRFDEYLRPTLESTVETSSYWELIVDDIDTQGPMVTVKIAKFSGTRVITTAHQVPRCQNN